MNTKIRLRKPRLKELFYRQTLLSQAETMAHRKNMNIESKYYHPETGCIDFPEEKWEAWYEEYSEPYTNLYYAYIVKGDNEFIGEASFYKSSDGNAYDMSILVEAKHRKQGYAQETLFHLLELAFETYKVNKIQFELNNGSRSAIKLCENAAFKVREIPDEKIEMTLNKFDYAALKQKRRMYS